jgi:hypothetical protein
MSCAKTLGIIHGCIGLIFLPFFFLAGLISLIAGRDSAPAGIAILFISLLVPVFYGVMGFVMGALMSWVYNMVARRIGGFQLELKPVVVANSQSNLGLV